MTDDSGTPDSSAAVATPRPARYGKQLVAHLGRRHGGEWSDDTATGWIRLGDGRAEVRCDDAALRLALRVAGSDASTVERLEDVVGRHLVRFGTRDELVVRWHRSDGRCGSVQGPA